MPIDNFGFYSLLVPFVDSYYKILRPEKARKLSDAIAYKYFDRLEYYSSLTYNFQYPIGEEIITEIERYRTLVEATIVNSDKNNLTKTIDNFIIASDPFIYLYGEFEFYTSLIDFVEGYYLGDAKIKAQELSKKITNEYKSRLVLFSQLEEDNQLRYLKRIKNYIMDYSYLVDIINQNDRSSYTDTINLNYEKTLGLFKEGIIQTK